MQLTTRVGGISIRKKKKFFSRFSKHQRFAKKT